MLLVRFGGFKKLALTVFDVFFPGRRLNYHLKNTEIQSYRSKVKSTNRKVCFFSSWDAEGKVHEYVIHYLKSLSELGFDIYFCSTSDKPINSDDLSKLKELCHHISFRQNIGLDFASWKMSYLKIPLFNRYDNILLANDSVFGPLFSLKDLFERADHMTSSVVSMTDSFEHSYHLQSYFLYFKGNAARKFLPKFFSEVQLLKDKEQIIDKYEIGLSTRLLSEGYSIEALFPYRLIAEEVTKDLAKLPHLEKIKTESVNQTIFFWNILIEKYQFPFIKRELLTKNVAPSKNIENWEEIVGGVSESSKNNIKRYLSNLK